MRLRAKGMTRSLPILALLSVATTANADKLERDDVKYCVVTSEPAEIRIIWSDGKRILRNFPAVHDFLLQRGEKPLVLMNGGIFEPTGVPSGLLIQDGKQLRPLNLADGEGNFYLKLGCPDALFLDGDLCQMQMGKEVGRPSNNFGSVIAIVSRRKGLTR
jgi:uncharacterized protein YigE (DUF2233 family)